jgi:hypothetical protein
MKRMVGVLALAVALGAGAAFANQEYKGDRQEAGVGAAERNDLRRDITQMRVLIDQMQRNLAQVSSGQTALKHQFELDIQMWQIVLNQMERDLELQKK